MVESARIIPKKFDISREINFRAVISVTTICNVVCTLQNLIYEELYKNGKYHKYFYLKNYMKILKI